MRNKALATTLNRTKTQAPRPQAVTSAWQRFAADIRGLLRENNIPGDWDWDETEQRFYTEWTAEVNAKKDGIPLHATVTHHVHLSLDLALPDEIERLIRLRDWFQSNATIFTQWTWVEVGE